MSLQNTATEPALGSESRLLRTLIDLLPDCVFVKDIQSRLLLGNLAQARMLGSSDPQAVRGKTDFDCLPAELAEGFHAAERSVLASGTTLEREETVVDSQTGETRCLQTTRVALHDGDGHVVGLVGISRDITARKRAEEALLRAHAELECRVAERTQQLSEANTELNRERRLLQSLIDNLPDRIFVKDRQGRYLLANTACAALLGGRRPQEVIGKSDAEFVPVELSSRSHANEAVVMNSGCAVNQEEPTLHKQNGNMCWSLTTKVPLKDEAGQIVGIIGIDRDITNVKMTEQRLETLHRELIVASRHAGMAEVATGVLHNVGNVLNSVNVSANVMTDRLRNSKVTGVAKLSKLLREHGADAGNFLADDERGRQVPVYLEQLAEHLEQEREELRHELAGLSRNIEHIKEIVATQQNYARVSGVIETVALPELVDDALRIHGGAYLRHGVSVTREFKPVPSISVDKHKVLQVLVNLLHNAKYACDAAGRDEKHVSVRLWAPDEGRVRVEVADNGIGIAEENMGRIFSQGFTTRKGGHGFGLHSGALAAKDLGGSLTVKSEGLGRGATFTLELPLAPPPRKGEAS